MLQFTLTRKPSTDQGTPGTIRGESLSLFTLELPWRDNMTQISCIPAGRFICKPYSSPKFRDVYELQNVPGRAAILIHTGNWAGDVAKGFRSDVQGCILVGLGRDVVSGQMAVTSSRAAMDKFRKIVGKSSFELLIQCGIEVST